MQTPRIIYKKFVSPKVTGYICLDLDCPIRICMTIKAAFVHSLQRIGLDSDRTAVIQTKIFCYFEGYGFIYKWGGVYNCIILLFELL